jgi:hypothetical protein
MAEPIAIYDSAPSIPISMDAAAQILHGWVNTAFSAPLAFPAHCPHCCALAVSLTIGRGEPPWFRIAPCGCLFTVAS